MTTPEEVSQVYATCEEEGASFSFVCLCAYVYLLACVYLRMCLG